MAGARRQAVLRILSFNDTYELGNLPKVATIVQSLRPRPQAVVVAGDFLSPSVLSSIDKGWGMVDVLNAVGVTHCCFGNHEADLPLQTLVDRIDDSHFTWLNTNLPDFPAPRRGGRIVPHDFVATPCGRVRVALLGCIADEPGMFRDNTFKGLKIHSVLDGVLAAHDALSGGTSGTSSSGSSSSSSSKSSGGGGGFRSAPVHAEAHAIVPLTHQSLGADKAVAELCAEQGVRLPAIIGGHEHELIVDSAGGCTIVKTGSDAFHVAVIDLHFTVHTGDAGADLWGLDAPAEAASDWRSQLGLEALAALAEAARAARQEEGEIGRAHV